MSDVEHCPLVYFVYCLPQVFYQGIDKVSTVLEEPLVADDDPPDDIEREDKGEGAEEVAGEGGGHGTTEPAEDPPAKEDDEPDENGDGEKLEMTDGELAARCRCCVLCRGLYRLSFLVRLVRSKLLNRCLSFAAGLVRIVEYYEVPQRVCSSADNPGTVFSCTYHVKKLRILFFYAAHALSTPQVCRIG